MAEAAEVGEGGAAAAPAGLEGAGAEVEVTAALAGEVAALAALTTGGEGAGGRRKGPEKSRAAELKASSRGSAMVGRWRD